MRLLLQASRLILLALSMGVSTPVYSQYWATRGGGPTIDEGMDICSDKDQNLYSTGYYTSSFTFSNITLNGSGLDDIFIIKTSPLGIVSWMKSAGGPGIEKPHAIACDTSGNIVVTGYYYGTSDFSGSQVTSAGQQDIFIAKYDSAGALLWVRSAGGINGDIANDIAFDESGNVILTGEFTGSCTFGSYVLNGSGSNSDVFIAKYDFAGNFLWAKSGTGPMSNSGTSIDTDPAGNIYVSGMFSDTITFDVMHPNTFSNTVFVVKMDPNGLEQWFRYMGSSGSSQAADIDVMNTHLNVTGDFGGNLYFFNVPGTPVLNGTHQYNIFIAQFDLGGNLNWKESDGSVSEVYARSLVTKPSGEIYIGGTFRCRMTDFSTAYGDGIFNSIGYTDTYIASYASTGDWLWSRHYGGNKNDQLNGMCLRNDSSVVSIGGFVENYIVPYKQSSFNFLGTMGLDYQVFGGSPVNYCQDPDYASMIKYVSTGNSDMFINAAVDEYRQPLDMFTRSGTICDRTFNYLCIKNAQGACADTLSSCSNLIVTIYPGTFPVYNYFTAPDLEFLWNTGITTGFYTVVADGNYIVTTTSSDGCYSYQDTAYVDMLTPQPKPQISDNKGINTNTPFPSQIDLCYPDSVQLECMNVGTSSVQWTGFPAGQNPVTVSSQGIYNCLLTAPNGCTNVTPVSVIVVQPLSTTTLPKLKVFEDPDGNDSITVCQNFGYKILVYDEFSNPGGNNIECFPEATGISWDVTPINTFMSADLLTQCPGTYLQFSCLTTGSFMVVFEIMILRGTTCDSDTLFLTDSLYVEVLPANTGTINVTVSGPTEMCYTDTIPLVASPSNYIYVWSNGVSNDTNFVTLPGTYTVNATHSVINPSGCTDIYYGSAVHTIAYYLQPVLSMIPFNGIVCPLDSVEMLCNGTGNVTWYGPQGNFGTGANPVYVNTPGTYFCVQEMGPGCELVSNNVIVFQYSSPALYAFPDTVCVNDQAQISIVASPGSTIQWLPPLSGAAFSQNVSPGTYTADVTACGITSTLSVTVNGYPVVQPVISFNFPYLVSSLTGTLQWYLNGLPIPGGNGTQFLPSQNGTYTVEITDTNNCDILSDPYVMTTVGIHQPADNFVGIYPNPTDGVVQLAITGNYFGNSPLLVVRDVLGRMLMNFENFHSKNVSLQHLPDGIYFLEIRGNGKEYMKKVVLRK